MTENTQLDIQEILRRLPHRYPFLLVDRVLEWRKGESIRALKNVTVNEPYFTGHFPERPVMPGVIIIEALAQAAGVLLFVSAGVVPDASMRFYFAGIDKARFRKPVLHARITAAAPPPEGKLVAFAGLARPEKFFDTLQALGATLEETVPYADHHPYSADELTWLTQLADERGARLITTEKDASRLTPEWRARVAVLPVSAQFEDDAALSALLAPIVSRMTPAHG